MLLNRIGRAETAATFRNVYSKTAQQYLDAVCCPACRAMQGNYFVGEHTLHQVSSHGLAGLDTLGLAPCRTAHWQHLVHDQSVAWLGPAPLSFRT